VMQNGPLRDVLKSNSALHVENARLSRRISELEAENRRMREALEQSLRQWKMYAELEEERDLEAEVTPEADLYRLARAALIHCDPLSGKGASKGV